MREIDLLIEITSDEQGMVDLIGANSKNVNSNYQMILKFLNDATQLSDKDQIDDAIKNANRLYEILKDTKRSMNSTTFNNTNDKDMTRLKRNIDVLLIKIRNEYKKLGLL